MFGKARRSGEIEAHLSKRNDLAQGLVLIREDQTDNPQLVAYVVPNGPVTPSAEILIRDLRSWLPAYMVPNAIVFLEKPEWFDADFFGFTPREADLLDPQQRIFLEGAWEALENAGYNPETYTHRIGLYAGLRASSYRQQNLAGNSEWVKLLGPFALTLATDRDFLPTRVAYKLNLKGPAVLIQTACSTSLVAVHQACLALQNQECEMAMAGGVSLTLPHKAGYLYEEGGIQSPDGYCRPFDAEARGAVGGSGMGIVVLKPLARARADGDHIHAVIKGSAINNDGAAKVGFTAPSIEGQAQVIAQAQARAGFHPESIGYVEAHGTGTVLGDPIEVAALCRAFSSMGATRRGYCALGSVKANVGHLDAAAGIAGLIKVILALRNRMLPPSLFFKHPNPAVDFEKSPFRVNARLQPWSGDNGPRRAGVSSFGIGGTNAHVLLEEAPEPDHREPPDPWFLLPLSARTETALAQMITRLGQHLERHARWDPRSVAFTLATGRKAFKYRAVLVAEHESDAVAELVQGNEAALIRGVEENGSLVFMFPGQGAQYVGMGRELYQNQTRFREVLDRCNHLLKKEMGLDLLAHLYPAGSEGQSAKTALERTEITQPALFALSYSLAQMLASWGLKPDAAIGHSIGEYVAACLAGVFSLEDALKLVTLRGRLMQSCEEGAMLAVGLAPEELARLPPGIDMAAVNGTRRCVVAGPHEAIHRLQTDLAAQGVPHRRLHTSHAFHSRLMTAAAAPFKRALSKLSLKRPTLPFISNVSGSWITDEEATSPGYWADHLRKTVRFSEGLTRLRERHPGIMLEVGPGTSLTALVRREHGSEMRVQATLRHPKQKLHDGQVLLRALGQLWTWGASVDWRSYFSGRKINRIPLPSYPFQRQRHWIDPKPGGSDRRNPGKREARVAHWFYLPTWKQVPGLMALKSGARQRFLIFADTLGYGHQLAALVRNAGHPILLVAFDRCQTADYFLNPEDLASYRDLFQELVQRGWRPDRLLHFWSLNHSDTNSPCFEPMEERRQRLYGFESLLQIGRGMALFPAKETDRATHLWAISNGLFRVIGKERVMPEKAPLMGACKVLTQEFPFLSCHHIDIQPTSATLDHGLCQTLWREVGDGHPLPTVAYRWNRRWVMDYQPSPLPPGESSRYLRPRGLYLITGGLGGMGFSLAKRLARQGPITLVLMSRSEAPLEATQIAGARLDPNSPRLDEWRRAGAFIELVRADVTDPCSLAQALDPIRRRLGPFHGVIHAAGVAGGQMISFADAETNHCVFAPKVTGTLVLAEYFKREHLDFFVLCSSINALGGGVGQAAYCAANGFMDQFSQAATHTTWAFTCSVNWDAWRELGMAARMVASPGREAMAEHLREQGISPDEGFDALTRILAAGVALGEETPPQGAQLQQVIVTPMNLAARLEQIDALFRDQTISHPSALNPKADRTRSQANRTEVELLALWKQLFGNETIDLNRSFVELGGDSLLATTVTGHLRKTFMLNIGPDKIMENGSIDHLVTLIDESQPKNPPEQNGLEIATPVTGKHWEERDATPDPKPPQDSRPTGFDPSQTDLQSLVWDFYRQRYRLSLKTDRLPEAARSAEPLAALCRYLGNRGGFILNAGYLDGVSRIGEIVERLENLLWVLSQPTASERREDLVEVLL